MQSVVEIVHELALAAVLTANAVTGEDVDTCETNRVLRGHVAFGQTNHRRRAHGDLRRANFLVVLFRALRLYP